MATTSVNETTAPVIDEQKLEQLREILGQIKTCEQADSYLIRALHKTQQMFGYLPIEAMDMIAQEMGIPTAHIWGVATFYHYFNLNPPGKYTISVCLGTACYVKGAGQILETIKNELKIDLGETTPDSIFSLQPARCLGACGLAPVVMINEKIHGDITPKKMIELIKKLRKEASK